MFYLLQTQGAGNCKMLSQTELILHRSKFFTLTKYSIVLSITNLSLNANFHIYQRLFMYTLHDVLYALYVFL